MDAEHNSNDNAAMSVNNTLAGVMTKEASQGGDDALVKCATAKYVEPPCDLHGNEASEAATATTNITTSTITANNNEEHPREEVAAAMPIVVDESSAARKTNSSSSLTLGRASPLCFSSGQHSRSLSKIPALDGAAIVREVAEEAAQAEAKAAEHTKENEEESEQEENIKSNEEDDDDERHEAVGDETPESGLMSTQPPCRDHKTIVTSSGQRMTKGAAQVARRANSSRRNDLLDRSTSSLTSNKTRFSTPSPTSSTSLSMRLSLQRMRSGQLLEAAIHRSSPSRNVNTTESNGSQGGANNNNTVVVEGQEASTCASTGGSSGNNNNVLPLVGPRVEGERMPSPDSGGMCTYRNVLRARAESLIGFHSRQQSQSSQRSQQQQTTQQTQTVQTQQQQVQGMSVSEEQSYASSQVHTPGQTVRQDAVPPAPPSSSSGTSGVYAEQPMFYIPTMPNTNSPHAQTWLSSQTLRTDSASSQYQVESEEEALSAAGGGMMNYYHNNPHHRRNRSTGSMNCHAPYGNNAAFAPPWPRMGLAATPDMNDDVDPNAAPTTNTNTSAVAGMAQRANNNAYYPHAHHHHRRISTSSSASRQAQGTPPNAQSGTGCNTGAWHSRAPTQLSDQASVAPPQAAASMAWFDTAAEMTGENTATNTSHTESHLRLAYPFSSSAQNSTTNLSGGANANYPQQPNYHYTNNSNNNSSSTGQSNSNPNTSRKPMAGQGEFEVNDPYSYDAVRRHSRGDYWSSESYGTPSDGTQMAASASYPNNTINTADNHRHLSERAIGGEEYGPHSKAHAAIDLHRRCRPARLSPHALSSAASAMTAFANALQMHAETHHNFSDDEGDDESSDSHGSHRPLLRETQPPRPPSSTEHDNNNHHHNNVLHDPSLLLSLAERKAIIVPPPATNEELPSPPDKEEQGAVATNDDNTMNIAVTAGEAEGVNKEAGAGQSEETTSASLAMQQQRVLQTPGTNNNNMDDNDEDDDGALSLPPHTSDSAPETIFAPAGDTPTMTAQQLVQLLESASNGDPSVEVCSPPGWSFSVYDADISQHYSIPSENIVITRGAIKYLMLYERYGQQTRFRFQLCKRYLHERCTSGAECHYIHSRAVPTSTWVHVNDNCVSALGSHRLTEEELAGGKNTQHYITMPPGVLFHVYPPNQGNSPPQIIPSELILYTIGATNVYRVLLQNMNAEAQGVRELTYNNNVTKGSMQPQLMYVMSSRDIQELSRLRPRHCAHFQFKRMCNLGTSCNFIHSLVPFVQGIVNQPPLPPRYLRAPTAMTYADPTALAPMPANTTTTATTPKAVSNTTQTMMMMAATAAKSHVYAPTQLQQQQTQQQTQTTQSFSYINSATPQRQAMMSSTSGLPLTNTTMSSATPMTSTRMSYTQDGRPTTVTWYEVSPLAQLGTANERTNNIAGQSNAAVNERDRLKYVRLAQQQASLGPARTAGGEEVMPYEYIGPGIARPSNTFTQSSGTTTMMVMMPQPTGQNTQDVAAQNGEGTLQGRQGLRYPSLMTLTGATAANSELHAQLYGWTNQQQAQQQQQASSPYGDARMLASPNTAQILAADARAARNARVQGEMQVVPEANIERSNVNGNNNNGAGLDTCAMPYYRPTQVTSTGIASQQVLQQEDERTNEANELYNAPQVPTPNNSTNVISSSLRPPFAAPTTATRLVPVDYHTTTTAVGNNGEDEGSRQEVYELYNEGNTNTTMPPLPVAASSSYQIQRDGYTKSSSGTAAANVSAQFIRSRRASNVSETIAGAAPPHWTLLHATANQPNNTTTTTPSGLVPPALPHRSSSTLYTSPTSHTSMREYEAFMGQSLSTSATPTMYEYAAAAGGNSNVLTRPDYRRMSSASSSSPLARSAMQEGEARNAASRPPAQQQMMMMSAIQRGNQAQTYNAGRSTSSSHAPYGMPVLSPVVTPEVNQAATNNSQAQLQQQAPSSITTNTAPQQIYHTNSITSSSSNGGGGATRYAPLTNVASVYQTGSTTTTGAANAATAPGFPSLQTSEWLGKPYSTDSETGRSMPSYANEALSSLHEAAAQKRSSGASLQSAPITPHYGVAYGEARSEADNNTNNNSSTAGVRRQGALPASVPNSATTTPNMSATRVAVQRRQLRQSNE